MDFNKLAILSMRLRKRLSVTYSGEERLVEVHAIGVSTANRPCVRVYQVMGGSISGEDVGWKMMSTAKIQDAKLVDDRSLAPRPGYQPGDKGMSHVIMEICDVEEESGGSA